MSERKPETEEETRSTAKNLSNDADEAETKGGELEPSRELARRAPRPSGRALANLRPACESCNRKTADGCGGEFGDETFEWLCSDCYGARALARYQVDDADLGGTR